MQGEGRTGSHALAGRIGLVVRRPEDAPDPGCASIRIRPRPRDPHGPAYRISAEAGAVVPGDGVPSMRGRRRIRILEALAEKGGGDGTTARLCEVSRRMTGVTGAGILLMSDDAPLGSVCAANDVSALIESLQYTLGEGPCIDAYRLGRPVLEPDLADPAEPRWLAFTGPAVDAGVRAIFGFPIGVGSVHLGALNLYVDTAGPLTDDQHADALVMAEIAGQAVLVMQTECSGEALAAELEEGSDFHYVVHQAAGMVSAQLEVSVGQALVRLRAHAFASERALDAIAADVVARRLRFTDEAA